jgi:hypothetical protein
MSRASSQLARLGRLFLLGGMAAWLVVAVGCGKPVGDVTGKVTVKGQPLEYGTVTFLASDGTGYQGEIQPNGTYSIKGVPVGTAKIAVLAIDPKWLADMKDKIQKARDQKDVKPGANPFAKGAHEREAHKTPQKAEDAESSGITYDVKGGQNKYDIDL